MFSTSLAHHSIAAVQVEPTTPLINQRFEVAAGAYSSFDLRLEASTNLIVRISVEDWPGNDINTWLVDLPNYQRLQAGQEFSYFEEPSGSVQQNAFYRFVAPTTNVYYLVFDNRSSRSKRVVTTRVFTSGDEPTEHSKATEKFYSGLYDYLKKLFEFEDFDIYVMLCGTANAYSTPDIVICQELHEMLTQQRVPGAITFAFLHEAAHSLLHVWDYPLFDNEDAADELATFLLLVIDQKDLALQAAQWWSRSGSDQEALSKLYVDDRHAVSPQRARNIVAWLNEEEDIERRWLRLLAPRMTTEVLEAVIAGESDPEETKIAQEELARRE